MTEYEFTRRSFLCTDPIIFTCVSMCSHKRVCVCIYMYMGLGLERVLTPATVQVSEMKQVTKNMTCVVLMYAN